METKKFNKLIQNLKTDRKAFDIFYEYYFPKIVIHINSKFVGLNMGEDIAQEFFLNILNKDKISYVEFPNAWVYTIVDDMAKNKLKKDKSTVDLEQKYVASTIEDLDLELYGEYKDLLLNLDSITRQIIILHVFEGYKFREIADFLNMKHDAVRQRFCRGMKKLKKF